MQPSTGMSEECNKPYSIVHRCKKNQSWQMIGACRWVIVPLEIEGDRDPVTDVSERYRRGRGEYFFNSVLYLKY